MKMKIEEIHSLNIEVERFETIQTLLFNKISLKNRGIDKGIKFCAGVDLAYWKEEQIEWGVCSIIVIDYETGAFVEKTYSAGKVTVPYIPGYLAFRELPLIVRAAKKLTNTPDLFMFDGNGYLHPRHMGIATHASFFLNKPTIGVAKSYFKIRDADFRMPGNEVDSYENITVGNEVYGRALRTHKDVKPIFISCGNYIDLGTTTEIALHLINGESRLPIPVRLADLETKVMRKQIATGKRNVSEEI
jgi:deoxyribonuclease V